jgi:DNA-binding transcriptional MerR regulator
MNRFYLVSELARELRCSAETVRELDRRVQIKAERTPTGTRIFTADDLRRLKEERAAQR